MPSNALKLTDQDRLIVALQHCVTEMRTLIPAACDHDASICSASYVSAIENGQRLIDCHKRSAKFIAELYLDTTNDCQEDKK